MSTHPLTPAPGIDEAGADRLAEPPTGPRPNRYAAGTRFEHKTRDDLISNGYEVIRAAGSKASTKVDLIAVKPGSLIFIQCKAAGTLPPAEWDRLVEVAGWVGATPVLAANGPRGRGVAYTRLLGPKRPRARHPAVRAVPTRRDRRGGMTGTPYTIRLATASPGPTSRIEEPPW